MKKILSAFLVLVILSAFVMSASAVTADVADTGKTTVTIGDWVYESISGDRYWEVDDYIGEGGDIVIPRIVNDKMVTALGSHCFAEDTTVTSVVTSSPLWTVGEYAFLNCTSIESFECNFALKEIGVGAFSGTTALKSINLETSVITVVRPHAFMSSGIEQVILPDTCTEIMHDAFSQCASLQKILIPRSVVTIDPDAFTRSDSMVIYCYTDSAAHQYAEEKGIDYVLLDAPVEVDYMVGDADGDSKITILDATKVQRVLAALVQDPDGMIALRGDTDGNGLDILDATRIQRWLAGFTVADPIGEETTGSIIPVYF